jgi:glycosyltransferase involved in cell wall biosynthesis
VPRADARPDGGQADVCLVLEGSYPYVKGGVSTWVHQLIHGLPELRFSVVHVGPERGAYRTMPYALPPNVVALRDLYCREPAARVTGPTSNRGARAARARHARPHRSRVLDGIRRLHVPDEAGDGRRLADLAAGDLPVGAFLHGQSCFDLTAELCERLAPEASFLDFFWHFRSMHLPLVRLLAAEAPPAAMYHAICTGYAGALAAVWSRRTGRPLLLTEHGIYARERRMELDRADWLCDRRASEAGDGMTSDGPTAPALRNLWAGFFRALSRCVYAQATAVVSICEVNRARQIADGAPAGRTLVVPNGIELEGFLARLRTAPGASAERRPPRVGFVGRLAPIKDVVTFIRACSLALREVGMEVRIIGPAAEDPGYARRCRLLVEKLGLGPRVRFEPTLPVERIYPELDVLALTSFSEGQPLVILEANAAGLPVVASDVGACRELLEGRTGEDRGLGPSGIVTRLAAPEETAAAIVRLVRDPGLRRRLGDAGRRRVAAFYQLKTTLEAYRTLYAEESWPASAGASSA